MCGQFSNQRRIIKKEEIEYLDKLVRGVYLKRDLKKGYEFSSEKLDKDFYLAIPLKKGQLSCRELLNGERLTKDIKKDSALMIEDIDGPYSSSDNLKKIIQNRGI